MINILLPGLSEETWDELPLQPRIGQMIMSQKEMHCILMHLIWWHMNN